jgi:hypothetical protein
MLNLSTEPLWHRAIFRPLFSMIEEGGTGGSDSGSGGGDGSADSGENGQGEGDQSDESGEDDFDSLPAATQAEIRRLRRQNKQFRAQIKAGKEGDTGKGGQEPPNPAEAILAALRAAKIIPEDVTTGKTTTDDGTAEELRAAKVETAVYRVAGPLGANADAVTDSLGFRRATADLDPSDPDFEKDVRAAVQETLRTNPALKSGTAKSGAKSGSKSGGDLNGGGSGSKETAYINPQHRLAAAYAANSQT